jgi:hypothetical protein
VKTYLNNNIKPAWLGLAFLIGMFVIGLRLFEPLFGKEANPLEMPILSFSVIYVLVGLIFILIVSILVKHSQAVSQRHLLLFIMVVAVLLRLGLAGVPSILEDDYNRYLWDGAVTASGLNPYAFSPEQVLDLRQENSVFDDLINQSKGTFLNINHPEFSTVYPPVAQVVFALNHLISPFSLDALRLVMLVLELGCIGLILLILRKFDKSPLWVVLYAWNPLVLKEVTNSVHMEPILMLPVLVAVYLVLQNRMNLASCALAVAAGVKIWPALLVLVIWRQLLQSPVKLVQSGLAFGIVFGLMVAPIILTGLSETSGFVAFGGQWQASSAAYLVSDWLSYLVTPYWVDDYLEIPLISRLILGLVLLAVISVVCFRLAQDTQEMIWRMFLITAAIYILSPSNTPWYFVWIAPFLCLFPSRSLLLAGALIPLHYTFFYFSIRDMPEVYQNGIVWLIWLPVWALILVDFMKSKTAGAARQVAA